MKLRARFPRLQLLFLLGFSATLAGVFSAKADVLITADGRRMDGKVLGVQGTNVQFQTQAGTIGWPLANTKEVQVAAPPEFAAAQGAFAAKDVNKALQIVAALVAKYKGLPVDWAQQATAMLGDLYIANKDFDKAEAAYKEFQRIYPGAGGVQAEVGTARIAVSKKDYATAKSKLEPIIDAALKDKAVSRANAYAYSQAFLAMGEIKEGEGNLQGALEDYLRTVTIFYYDPTAVAAAQEKADALRASQKITAP